MEMKVKWGLITSDELVPFLSACRAPYPYGYPTGSSFLVTLSVFFSSSSEKADCCRLLGPLQDEEILTNSRAVASLPLRDDMLDCFVLILKGDLAVNQRNLSVVKKLASHLRDHGVAFVLYGGEANLEHLAAFQQELFPAKKVVSAVRVLTDASAITFPSRVIDLGLQAVSGRNNNDLTFTILQIEDSKEEFLHNLTAESVRAHLVNLIDYGRQLDQPTPVISRLLEEDHEFFRCLPPDNCNFHLPNYYDWRVIYPELQLLVDNYDVIAKEAFRVAGWTAWPEYHFREGGETNDWTVYPFLHTFPATDPNRSKWIEATCSKCPETVKLLKKIPHIRTALLSRLGPMTKLSAHTGWEDLANFVLRCHFGLKIPAGHRCGLWVEGEVRPHEEKDIAVFDDSKIHKAFNVHENESRIVLIIDIMRPADIPKGIAVGGHTPELDSFISAFK